jgi:hypothetical protein
LAEPANRCKVKFSGLDKATISIALGFEEELSRVAGTWWVSDYFSGAWMVVTEDLASKLDEAYGRWLMQMVLYDNASHVEEFCY